MTAHNCLSVASLLALTAVAGAASAPEGDRPADGLSIKSVRPDIRPAQRRFLSTLVRRTLRDAILARPKYAPSYTPKALQTIEGEVVVRLRQGGYLRATGTGGPAPLAIASGFATQAALASLRKNSKPDLELLSRLLIEIEVIGSVTNVPRPEGQSWQQVLNDNIEPGVHGALLSSAKDTRGFCPTEIFTSDLLVSVALARLVQDMGVNPAQISNLSLRRFRSDHWYESVEKREIVALTRGLIVLPEAFVTRRTLDRAIQTLGQYMMYRQLPSGAFSYQYEPSKDVYTDEDNLVRQAGCAVAMSYYARVSEDPGALRSADRALENFLHNVDSIPEEKEIAYISTTDGLNKLGVTALVCLALTHHPRAESYAPIRRKLVSGMLWLQQPSGLFITAFPPAESVSAQNYFPGEALLALACHYRLEPSSKVNEAFARAIRFYRDFFHRRRSPAFVSWQVQAFALMARQSKRQDYVDYVFEMTDWLADKQINKDNCPYPEMWGGIASYTPGRAGVSTATYLEGFADALSLARTVGDKERAQRYEHLVTSAARFVMQLQFRPEEAYFVRSPQDAVGGIRTSPSLNLLRIDHCQHALVGLIKARQVLFDDQD